MNDLSFQVIIEKEAEGYNVGSVPSLPGCHTQAKSLDKLQERIREAIALFLEVNPDSEESLEFVGVQQVHIAR